MQSHPEAVTADFIKPEQAASAVAAGKQSGVTYVPRTQAEIAAFFSGLDPGAEPIEFPAMYSGAGFVASGGKVKWQDDNKQAMDNIQREVRARNAR